MKAPATDGRTRDPDATGLTSEEARRRLRTLGANEIVPSRLRAGLDELRHVLLDPMGLMLLGLAGLYAMLGQRSDALVLLVAYVPVTVVDVALQVRARKALQALKATLRPTAKLLRDGRVVEVPVREIVPGDVIAFEEGQTLPADGTVLQ